MKDIDSYKFKAKDVQLKRKILPSIFNEDGPEQALAAEKDKRAEKGKTRRRQKRKQGVSDYDNEDNTTEHISKKMKESTDVNETITNEHESKSSKRRKRKKKNNIQTNEETIKSNTDKKVFSSGPKYGKPKGKAPALPKKNEINAEMRMSDKRLEAYGISSNTFKRKKMKEKYRQGTQ